VKPQGQLEQRLHDALRRPERSAWPDERGAFDRFRRWRFRRGLAMAARASLALAVALAVAVVAPRLLSSRPVGPVKPPGRVVQVPAGGFEVGIPAGWTRPSRNRVVVLNPRGTEGSAAFLRPMRKAADTGVVVSTAILTPRQYPGIQPGTDPDPSGTTRQYAHTLDDVGSPLGQGRRPDGRPYVWRTKLGPGEVGEYAVAWPYQCYPSAACPPTARWRALLVSGRTAEDATTRQRVLAVMQRIVDTARPITNALPGGDPGQVDPAVPQVQGRWLLGAGGAGPGAWQLYVRQGGSEDGLELHFPARKLKPGMGVHAEDLEPSYLQQGELAVMRDCLSWLPRQVMLLSGAVAENVTSVRIELAGRPPVVATVLGRDKPAHWAGFVSPPLPRGTRVTRVVALDAGRRTVAEAHGYPLSHPACHVFR
jgi:hypothetical protein